MLRSICCFRCMTSKQDNRSTTQDTTTNYVYALSQRAKGRFVICFLSSDYKEIQLAAVYNMKTHRGSGKTFY